MAKGAGFLKRLKNFGGKFIQGLDWVNDNIVKPVRKVTDPLLEGTKWGGLINDGLDLMSNTVDYFADKSRGSNTKLVAGQQPVKGLPNKTNYSIW